MGIMVPWLADAARMTGYPVNEVNGWRNRGHGGMAVCEGAVCHHTADGPRGDYPSLGIVTNGRAGLAGPLANYGLGRSGTIYVVAAGCAWHAGASSWAGFSDLNNKFLGIEAESVGTRDDWSPEQRDCYPRLCAAICHYIRRNSGRIAGHKEVCIPRGRKIDPAFWDMNAMRGTVSWMLGDPGARIPRGGGSAAPAQVFISEEEETGMLSGSWLPSNTTQRRVLSCPVAPYYMYKDGWFSLVVGFGAANAHVWFVKRDDKTGKPAYLGEHRIRLETDLRQAFHIPPGTEQISVQYDSTNPIGWSLELTEDAPPPVEAAKQ